MWVPFVVVWVAIDVLNGHAGTITLAGSALLTLIIQRRWELALNASSG